MLKIPNRIEKTNRPADEDPDPWLHVHFRVNRFTENEWGTVEVLSIADFSLGEEQSECLEVALAWSPSGPGTFSRCLLAVLTSNLLLSMWDPGEDPSLLESWNRLIVINEAIGEYFEDRPYDETSEAYPEGVWARRKRLRAFAWAPVSTVPEMVMPWTLDSGVLAVANDFSEIIFVLVENRFDVNSNTPSVEIHILGHYAFKHPTNSRQSYLYQTTKNEISWGGWSMKDGKLISSLTYCVNEEHGKLFVQAERSPSEVIGDASTVSSHMKYQNGLILVTVYDSEILPIAVNTSNPWSLRPPDGYPYLRECLDDCKEEQSRVVFSHTNYEKIPVHEGDLHSAGPTTLDISQDQVEIDDQIDQDEYNELDDDIIWPWTSKSPNTDVALLVPVHPLEQIYRRFWLGPLYRVRANLTLAYTNFCAILLMNHGHNSVVYGMAERSLSRIIPLYQPGQVLPHSQEQLNDHLSEEKRALEILMSQHEHNLPSALRYINECIKSWTTGKRGSADTPNFLERCMLEECNRVLFWDGLFTAQCAKGHTYGLSYSLLSDCLALTRHRALRVNISCYSRTWSLEDL